jgi:hypothetical protein
MRASFFALGLFVALWGVSFLFVDKLVLESSQEPQRQAGFRGMFATRNAQQQEVIDPPPWAAFCFMSVGAVTMLYSFALPKKKDA